MNCLRVAVNGSPLEGLRFALLGLSRQRRWLEDVNTTKSMVGTVATYMPLYRLFANTRNQVFATVPLFGGKTNRGNGNTLFP